MKSAANAEAERSGLVNCAYTQKVRFVLTKEQKTETEKDEVKDNTAVRQIINAVQRDNRGERQREGIREISQCQLLTSLCLLPHSAITLKGSDTSWSAGEQTQT